MKGDAASYKKILTEISCNTTDVAFFTDVPTEARAAKETGITAIPLSREGNNPLTDVDKAKFPVITSFTEIEFDNNCKKRKFHLRGRSEPSNPNIKSNDDVEMMESSTTEDSTVEQKIELGEGKKVELGEEKKVELEEEKKAEIGEEKKAELGEEKKAEPGEEKMAELGEEKKAELGEEKKAELGEEKKAELGEEKKAESGEEKKMNKFRSRCVDGHGTGPFRVSAPSESLRPCSIWNMSHRYGTGPSRGSPWFASSRQARSVFRFRPRLSDLAPDGTCHTDTERARQSLHGAVHYIVFYLI
ncbi:C-1-tetrahydrofolate synthase, cytoplasmic [Homalodisca vitripennis]|nr:C-1-tetrahydrofolate synthase, cytoplasmic [Homalodisca vitripennis]